MRRKLVRTVVAGVSALVAVGVVAIAGDGNPVQDVRLLSGAAWFSSSKVGQLTLLDGASGEVSAQVQVAPAGNLLEVVQQGATAYAVDQTLGTVRRIDGSTFALTQPEAPIPDARAGLTAVAGPAVLYTLDTQRGILASTDPKTLTRRGEMISVASKLTAGTAAADDDGTLWTIDTATGNLHRVTGERRNIIPKVAQPGQSTMTIANGHPVVIDRTGRQAISVQSATGSVDSSIDLDIRDDDTVQVSGSPHNNRLYVIASRGVLSICDLTASTCDNAIPLSAGNEFGAAVETGNRLFVPNYTTGEVWIVDLAQNKVVAKPVVLQAGRFQLLSRDGLVFYNDIFSEKAGVIHLDGTFTPTAKYDPRDPTKGLNTPPSGNNPGTTQPTRQPDPGTQDPRKPEDPRNPRDPQDAPKPPKPGDPVLQVTMSDTTPQADQVIELTVANTAPGGSPVQGAEWDFGDDTPKGGAVSTSHKWATAREAPYQVTVSATMQDGKTALRTVPITVSDKPTHRLTVAVPGGGGVVTGQDIACPGDCEGDIPQDTIVTLTAQPDAEHQAGTWTGCTSTAGNKCQVTMDAAKSVSHAFKEIPPDLVRLTIETPTGGRVTGGGLNCPTKCFIDVPKGTPVTLDQQPNQYYYFVQWDGACGHTTARQCTMTVNGDGSVRAMFAENPRYVVKVMAKYGIRSGNGTVTFEGQSCTAPCELPEQFISRDRVISIKATPKGQDRGGFSRLERWEGAPCSNSSLTCEVTITNNRLDITAYFRWDAG